jgi:hypothetical protein
MKKQQQLPLKARVMSIERDGLRKLVKVEWFVEYEDEKIVLVQDQFSVPGAATDDDIVAALRERKPQIERVTDRTPPDIGANANLLGAEVEP